jgi:hypothetical protein
MKLPIINKKVLNAKFVQVYWKDINSNSAWLNLKEAKASKVTICITVGWLIRADKDVHIIAGDVNFTDDGTLGDVGNVTTMPTVNILKIRRIKI